MLSTGDLKGDSVGEHKSTGKELHLEPLILFLVFRYAPRSRGVYRFEWRIGHFELPTSMDPSATLVISTVAFIVCQLKIMRRDVQVTLRHGGAKHLCIKPSSSRQAAEARNSKSGTLSVSASGRAARAPALKRWARYIQYCTVLKLYRLARWRHLVAASAARVRLPFTGLASARVGPTHAVMRSLLARHEIHEL